MYREKHVFIKENPSLRYTITFHLARGQVYKKKILALSIEIPEEGHTVPFIDY
jgi:hypothetical protein